MIRPDMLGKHDEKLSLSAAALIVFAYALTERDVQEKQYL